MFSDSNLNGINDYFERATHDPGIASGAGAHAYLDNNGDGVCDHAQNGSATWHGPGFIDQNGDGVCDYWQESSAMHNQNGGMHFHDSNGDGVNDYMEQEWHMGYGHGFIDQNGDGVCDYAQSGAANIYHGPGYEDADGNGVCDAWQSGGQGYGGGMVGNGHGPMM